jgi:hypothetical protein
VRGGCGGRTDGQGVTPRGTRSGLVRERVGLGGEGGGTGLLVLGHVAIALRELRPEYLFPLPLGEASLLLSLPPHRPSDRGKAARLGRGEGGGRRVENPGVGAQGGARGSGGGRVVNRPLGLGDLPGPALAPGAGAGPCALG